MGQTMGVVAVVCSLKVLRERNMWRQNNADVYMPIKPAKFALGGVWRTASCAVSGVKVFLFFLCFLPGVVSVFVIFSFWVFDLHLRASFPPVDVEGERNDGPSAPYRPALSSPRRPYQHAAPFAGRLRP